jgi:IS30 family transposase
MAVRRSPQPGRPTLSARQAAKLLKRDPRTIQRMVRDGELEGGSRVVNERTRWFVYSDQFTPSPAPRRTEAIGQQSEEIAELRAAVAKANAEKAATEETNRLLLASQSILLSAVEQYQQATEDVTAIADAYRQMSGRYADTATRFRTSADSFAQVVGNYRDIIAQFTAPDDLSSLGGGPQ